MKNQNKLTAEAVQKEFAAGKRYNESLDLYEIVKKNERFFSGDQWNGLKAPDIETPTLNFLERVVTYFLSMISSDDIGIQIKSFLQSQDAQKTDNILSDCIDRVIERTKLKAKFRECIRDAAVCGDAFMYFYFNPELETGQEAVGDVEAELIDNTNILFGNPFDADLQAQPYIIVKRRRTVSEVRREAKENNIAEWESIAPDSDTQITSDNDNISDDNRVTELIRFWKEKNEDGVKTVRFMRVCGNIVTEEPTDTGYRLYPLASYRWKKRKNSYHGQAALTYLIDNQIAVNRLWAMVMLHVRNFAFPKLIYDQKKVQSWSNDPGKAVAVVGNPNEAIFSSSPHVDVSSMVLAVVEKTISMTRDFMGASDAALGNVRPDNTSAIVAVQKASSAPLDLQRFDFYQFVEDSVRILADLVCTDYGERYVNAKNEETGEQAPTLIDFSAINSPALDINVDVGASSYWSETMQLYTMDNIFKAGILQDAELYFESLPDGIIRNKADILKHIKAQKSMMQAPPTAQTPVTPEIPTGEQELPIDIPQGAEVLPQ